MDVNYIQLLAEIESLKSQIAELRMAQTRAENVGGAGGAIGEMLFPIGQLGGSDLEIVTDSWSSSSGEETKEKALGNIYLTRMTNALGQFDTNIKFDISNNADANTTKIKIGVYYL